MLWSNDKRHWSFVDLNNCDRRFNSSREIQSLRPKTQTRCRQSVVLRFTSTNLIERDSVRSSRDNQCHTNCPWIGQESQNATQRSRYSRHKSETQVWVTLKSVSRISKDVTIGSRPSLISILPEHCVYDKNDYLRTIPKLVERMDTRGSVIVLTWTRTMSMRRTNIIIWYADTLLIFSMYSISLIRSPSACSLTSWIGIETMSRQIPYLLILSVVSDTHFGIFDPVHDGKSALGHTSDAFTNEKQSWITHTWMKTYLIRSVLTLTIRSKFAQ